MAKKNYYVSPVTNAFTLARVENQTPPDLLDVAMFSPLFDLKAPFSCKMRAKWNHPENPREIDMAEVKFSHGYEGPAVRKAVEEYRDSLLEPYEGDLVAYWDRLWFQLHAEVSAYYKDHLRPYGLNAVRLPVRHAGGVETPTSPSF